MRARKGEIPLSVLLAILAVVAALYFGYRKFYGGNKMQESSVTTAEDQKRRDDELAEKRRRAAEEDARRKLERQQEKERRERERAEQLEARKRQQREREERKETFRKIQREFTDKSTGFHSDLPKNDRIDFRTAETGTVYWAVSYDYPQSGKLYEISALGEGKVVILEKSESEPDKTIAIDELDERMATGVWAVADELFVWFWGTGKNAAVKSLVELHNDFYPIADELEDLYSVFTTFRMRAPEVKYRLTLKPKDAGEDLPLATIQSGEKVQRSKIRDLIRELISKRKLNKASSELRRPKLRGFRKTVEFYDGDKISKSLGGVTRIPRSFNYVGTSRAHDNYSHVQGTVDRARAEYNKLRAEAERQERQAARIEQQNEARMAEYEERRQALARGIQVRESEIDYELQKYDLLIERSKTKLPAHRRRNKSESKR